jgi:hypothetical protein
LLPPGLTTYLLIFGKSGTGSGTVNSDPVRLSCRVDCNREFAAGTIVTLTATPDTDSTFEGWSGGGCAGKATCTVTMNAITSVTAIFQPKSTLPLVPLIVLLL